MPQSDDFAVICPLSAVNFSLIGRKVRVAGKILSYDPITHLLLLAQHPHGVLVDMKLCLDPSQSLNYLRENKGTLMVMGSLDQTPVGVSIHPRRALLSESVNGV